MKGRRYTYPNFRCEPSQDGGLRDDNIRSMYRADNANQDTRRGNGKDHNSLVFGQLHTP